MNNNEVKRAFSEGKYGSAANLLSDGTSLWSYGWWEITRWIDGHIIVRLGQSYSTTTATKHRPYVLGMNTARQAQTETPVSQGALNTP